MVRRNNYNFIAAFSVSSIALWDGTSLVYDGGALDISSMLLVLELTGSKWVTRAWRVDLLVLRLDLTAASKQYEQCGKW